MELIEVELGNEMSPFEVCLNNLTQISKTKNSTYISLCIFAILYNSPTLNMLDVYRMVKEVCPCVYFNAIRADFNKESILAWRSDINLTHYLNVNFDSECEDVDVLKYAGFLCDKSDTQIIEMKLTEDIKNNPELHHKIMYGLRAFYIKDESG